MIFLQILKYIAVAVTLFTGVYSLIAPKKIKGFTGLEASSPRAITEIRSVMGGTFVALAIAAILFHTKEIFLSLALVYAVIGVIRAISIAIDKSNEKSNLISLVSEVILVIILIL